MSDDLKSFVDMLDQHYYLESERFRDYKKAVMLNFAANRPARRRMSAAVTKTIRRN